MHCHFYTLPFGSHLRDGCRPYYVVHQPPGHKKPERDTINQVSLPIIILGTVLSLYRYGQVHARMNRAVELEGTSRGERTNSARIVSIELLIFHVRCPRLAGRFR